MTKEKGKAAKKEELRTILIKSNGRLWDVKAKKYVSCLLGKSEDCHSRCNWLSIDDKGIARCQGVEIGKLEQKQAGG